MGFFGHLVVSRAELGETMGAEAEAGRWTSGVGVWRLPAALGEWGQVVDFTPRLVDGSPGGFLAASVFDSDGAVLQIGTPGRDVAWSWLHLEGLVSNLVLPWAPFDEHGEPLSEEEVAAQDVEWQKSADAYVEALRAFGLEGNDAAEGCRAWAVASGLEPAGVVDVRAALEATNVFVEETFVGLLEALGGVRSVS